MRGLYWFSHDLRLHDNPALMQAAAACSALHCCVVRRVPSNYDRHFTPALPGQGDGLGAARRRFLVQTEAALAAQLQQRGQRLYCYQGQAWQVIRQLVSELAIEVLYCSEPIGWDERQQLHRQVRQALPHLPVVCLSSFTLFTNDQLPMAVAELPRNFTPFCQQVRELAPQLPLATVDALPPPLSAEPPLVACHSEPERHVGFTGGEPAGLARLQHYLHSGAVRHYKTTRNALMGDDYSSALSPWLATGALSVRTVAAQLLEHEQQFTANESTQWLYYELLWREYFQWYALAHGPRLFAFSGVKQRRPLASFYPQRLQQWCTGNTAYPLVNACMRQLNATGFMSNRGRQIVASCLVNELALDWRYGAAYFSAMLIDYDVAANWGNWLYLAGVGADPRGHRHFDIAKQAAQYDPDGDFVRHWCGKSLADVVGDSVDAADWPCGEPS